VLAVKVLLTGASLLPAHGGPAFSVSRLATALAEAGVEVGLWAADQSARAPLGLPTEPSVQRLIGSEVEALESFGAVDILHDNGIWLLHNHRLASLASERSIARIVSTRGMLEPWAMEHKRVKKRVAWWLYQRRDLMRATCLHATAEKEAENVRALGIGVPIYMIPNPVDLPEIDEKLAGSKCEKHGREHAKIALFLGRLHPVKGLPMLIEAWGRVRPPGWRLQIAGPNETGFRAEMEKQVSAAGLTRAICFLGPITGAQKYHAFSKADLFVLPTYSESFGMVIGEALAHGLPVLTTTSAPWPMLPKEGCGWCVAPTVEGIVRGLRKATSHNSKSLREMGAKGRMFVGRQLGRKHIAKQFISIYHELTSPASR
jgi:glycosyltransferase involved in cell wall biosynthesis